MLSLGGKIVVILVALSTLGGTAAVIVHSHDARVIAEVAAKAAVLNLATERADKARLVAALTERAAQAEAQVTAQSHIKEAIASAKPSNFSCIRSPAGRAALGGLRSNVGSH